MPDPKLEAARQRSLAENAAENIADIRAAAFGAEKSKVSGLRPNKKKRPQGGYQAQAFREKADIAMQQRREIAAEEGAASRTLKGKMRTDFTQQRQRQFAKVKHKARIALQLIPSPITPVRVRGAGASRGTISREYKGQPPARHPTGAGRPTSGNRETGWTQRQSQQMLRHRVLSKGGMAHVGAAQVWRTSGYKQTEPGQDRSYGVGRTVMSWVKPETRLPHLGVDMRKRDAPEEYRRSQQAVKDKRHRMRQDIRRSLIDKIVRKGLSVGNFQGQDKVIEERLKARAKMYGIKET